jgi:transposase
MEENGASVIRTVPERARAKKPTPPRRGYSLDKKLQVVRETLAPGASVSVVAQRHTINTNIVFRWRRQYMRGELIKSGREEGKPPLSQAFVPVDVMGHSGQRALPAPEPNVVPPSRTLAESGFIEIETALGVKVRVTGSVDDRVLGLVLAELRRHP